MKGITFLFQIFPQSDHEFRMLQRHQTSSPNKLYLLPLPFHPFQFPATINLFFGEIAKAEFFSGICMNQRKIRSDISPCTQQIHRLVPVSDMLLIFMDKPFRRNRLPLPFSVNPLTDADCRLPAAQPRRNQFFFFHPACQQKVTVIDQPSADFFLFIKQMYIGNSMCIHCPAHTHPLFLHGLRLYERKILSQFLV